MMDSALAYSVMEKDMNSIKLRKFTSNLIRISRFKKTMAISLEIIKNMGKTKLDIKSDVQVLFEGENGIQTLLESDSQVCEVISKPGKFVFKELPPKKVEASYQYSAQTLNMLVNMLLSNSTNRKLIASEIGMDARAKHPETEYTGFINYLCSNLDQIKVYE